MATPRYRVLDENGVYASRSPQIQLLQLGTEHADSHVLSIRAQVNERIFQGEEYETNETPHRGLEPLNDEARGRMRDYLDGKPGPSDPTGELSMSGGHLSVSDVIVAQMDRLLADAERGAPPQQQAGEVAELRAMMAQLAEQVQALIALQAKPLPVRKS